MVLTDIVNNVPTSHTVYPVNKGFYRYTYPLTLSTPEGVTLSKSLGASSTADRQTVGMHFGFDGFRCEYWNFTACLVRCCPDNGAWRRETPSVSSVWYLGMVWYGMPMVLIFGWEASCLTHVSHSAYNYIEAARRRNIRTLLFQL